MYVVIVGCGRVGARLATSLAALQHDVAIVDKDPVSFAALGKAFNGLTIEGPGIDEGVLRRAGIEHAAAFAAVTSEDSVNIVAAQIARTVFAVPRVVGRVNSVSSEAVFREFGVETISPTDLGAIGIQIMLIAQGIQVKQVLGSGEMVIADITVQGKFVGHTLNEMEIPDKLRICAVMRQDRSFIPSSEYRSMQGDVLVAAIRRDAVGTIAALTDPSRRK